MFPPRIHTSPVQPPENKRIPDVALVWRLTAGTPRAACMFYCGVSGYEGLADSLGGRDEREIWTVGRKVKVLVDGGDGRD